MTFTWRGVEFHWMAYRKAFSGRLVLAQKTYWLFYQCDDRSPAATVAWCEWDGGHTRPRTSGEISDALDGAVFALEDHLQETMNNLQAYLKRTP